MIEVNIGSKEYARISEIHVPYESARKIKKSLSNMKLKDDYAWLETKTWLGNVLKHSLPASTVKLISEFKENDHQCALIIRGLPIDNDLCSTPLASACHIGIYQLSNIEPISYKIENSGLLFRHVVPSLTGRNEKSSHGSTQTFGHHVDNSDLPLTPELITEKAVVQSFYHSRLSVQTLAPRDDGADR